MPIWNPDQYLKFADQRARPCRDLANRIALDAPASIMDLGCGPGNSTAVLAGRWPAARLTGLDSSRTMIDAAAKSGLNALWLVGDITDWAQESDAAFNLIFSNAALQWVPDHAALYPRLINRLAANGALAVQIPSRVDIAAHRVMRELAAAPQWRNYFTAPAREWHAHDSTFYYDAVAPHAAKIDLWESEYLQVMDSADDIVEFYKGSGLRPFLEALPDATARDRFVNEYRALIKTAYPARPDGKVLFPFRRIFLIAYRQAPA